MRQTAPIATGDEQLTARNHRAMGVVKIGSRSISPGVLCSPKKLVELHGGRPAPRPQGGEHGDAFTILVPLGAANPGTRGAGRRPPREKEDGA